MEKDHTKVYDAHIRALRTAIAGLAVSVLAAGVIIGSENSSGFMLEVFAIILILLSFVPTLLET